MDLRDTSDSGPSVVSFVVATTVSYHAVLSTYKDNKNIKLKPIKEANKAKYDILAKLFDCHVSHQENMSVKCIYILYLLKPHFYIVKLGYAGVYIFFLFLLRNIDCVYSLKLPHFLDL